MSLCLWRGPGSRGHSDLAQVRDLGDLSGLTHIGGALTITDNELLGAEAAWALVTSVDESEIGGLVTISGNRTDCD